jgi:hypothetical protein
MKPKELEKLGFKPSYFGEVLSCYKLQIVKQVSIEVVYHFGGGYKQTDFVLDNPKSDKYGAVTLDVHTLDDLKNVIKSTREVFKPRIKFELTE